MKHYDFDTPIERRGTDSLKFDSAESSHRSSDLMPLWVADMDFALPGEVTDALSERVAHGIFGYTIEGDAYYDAVNDWLSSRYGWSAPKECFVLTPGIVFALATAVRAFTDPGDAVLIQQPVYYPFSGVVKNNGRKVVNAPLVYEDGAYSIDFEAFERAIVENQVKLFLLCNPHNPVGRVWTAEELKALMRICLAHDVIVVSDEIHMDFVRPGYSHTSVATLGDEARNHSIICTSVGKTFNLAGLQTSNIAIFNKELHDAFKWEAFCAGFSHGNTMGLLATQLCYQLGGEWLAQLKDYLEGNWKLLADHLAANAPQLRLIEAQGTYLAWVDCRALGLFGKDLERFIEDEAGLWLDCGDMFGPDGDGFIRINIATQRAYLRQALTQLTDAVARRGY